MMSSIGKPYCILILLFAYASGQQTPTLCNDGNQGLCECGTDGINTYVFTPGDYKRCIHTFIPASNNKLPVLLTINGYGQAMLDGNEGVTGYARDYGFAVFGVGSTGPFTGDGGFGLDFPGMLHVNILYAIASVVTKTRMVIFVCIVYSSHCSHPHYKLLKHIYTHCYNFFVHLQHHHN
uniref:Uncharacterized protein n=1 Tax=Chaetoceros debilis TaxID=122233 RepID=A0A7S3QFB0_9STRA